MKANYVLTTFSPAMFGEKATMHISIIPPEKAKSLIADTTKIVATRVGHDRLARTQLPGADLETSRYASLKPDIVAVHLHYRGPPIGDDGELPLSGQCTFYLIEVEEFQEHAE